MSSERVPHHVTLTLPPADVLVGLVSLRLSPEAGYLSAVGHKIDSAELPKNTPALLRQLADELEVQQFREALDAPAS